VIHLGLQVCVEMMGRQRPWGTWLQLMMSHMTCHDPCRVPRQRLETARAFCSGGVMGPAGFIGLDHVVPRLMASPTLGLELVARTVVQQLVTSLQGRLPGMIEVRT
jgi:hypothetical protein